MSSQWQAETEIPPRASIDTIIEEPSSPKVESQGTQARALPETHVGRDDVRSATISPVGREAPGQLRVEIPPETRQVEWEHIRTQLGMGPEERRTDWERIREELGLSDEDEGLVSVFKKIGQAFLVLVTTPFMLCHGVFKMTGALLRSLGMIFTGLAKLSKKLTYRPKKRRSDLEMQAGNGKSP